MTRSPSWYVRRLRQMSLSEMSSRAVDHARHRTWAHRQVALGVAAPLPAGLVQTRDFAGDPAGRRS